MTIGKRKSAIKCPYCGDNMILRETHKYTYKDGSPRKFYGCRNFRNGCIGVHGAHPDGTPLGIPATKEVKELRMKAHKLLEGKFGLWDEISRKQKKKQYDWLGKNTKSGHIGKMLEDELIELIKILEV